MLSTCKKSTLIFLNTMVGTGKTVVSIAISQFLQRIRDEVPAIQKQQEDQSRQLNDAQKQQTDNFILQSDLSQMQLLYCCPLGNVRTQVGSAAYQKKLKFAVASMWNNPSKTGTSDEKELGYKECPRIVNSWSCQAQEFPTLIVSDFATTLELLKEKEQARPEDRTVIRWQGKKREILSHNPSKNGNQYILFIDEPTVDADIPDQETTKLLVQIMRYAPPITILSSATLPAFEKLPQFIKLMSKRHGDVEIKTIVSQQFQIGCQIFSHNGHKFLPHYRITTKKQLSDVLTRLEQNPFMQRCYNANAYCELYDRAKKLSLPGLEDFEEFDLITQEIVQQKSIDLLKRLLNEDESLISKICSEEEVEGSDEEDGREGQNNMQMDFTQEEESKKNNEEMDEEDKMRFAAPYKKLRARDLAGKLAHKFEGGCLIAVEDPVKLIRNSFSWLIKDTRPASEYIKLYEKQLDMLGKLKEKKEKEIDNEDERSKQVQAIEENMNLSIEFPDKLKINTLEHYKKFVAGNKVHLLNRYRARKAFSLEGINLSLGVPDDILLYLFAGIASYTTKKSEFPQDYYDEIENLATNGQLAYIVSDDSMCYGVNYPLNHVIVYDEMASQRSMGALFQLIGRAGRVGVSWVANAYLEEGTFNRLVSYLEGKDIEDPKKKEEFNIEFQAKKLIDELTASAKARRVQKQQEQKQE